MTLNHTERAQAEEAGEKLFEWERLAEEHAVVLRKDPNAYAEAWEQFNAEAPPIGTMTFKSELSRPVQKAILEYRTAKHTQHQYEFSQAVRPEHPHSLLLDFFGAGSNTHVPTAPPALEYPFVLPGQPFS
ncbi:hypothetical protein CPB85DRAFT_1432804 [Mucidula mucida]|nr:hypothetical protein CPB85DRAFT_1432804 [Mucidula mucida]